jgi:hypothetical protein
MMTETRRIGRPNRVTALIIALLAIVAGACSEGMPVRGRYYQGLKWIEFGPNGQVRHGEIGDTARFRRDGRPRVSR